MPQSKELNCHTARLTARLKLPHFWVSVKMPQPGLIYSDMKHLRLFNESVSIEDYMVSDILSIDELVGVFQVLSDEESVLMVRNYALSGTSDRIVYCSQSYDLSDEGNVYGQAHINYVDELISLDIIDTATSLALNKLNEDDVILRRILNKLRSYDEVGSVEVKVHDPNSRSRRLVINIRYSEPKFIKRS